ncbi:MAG: hypothetical protein K8Q89_00290 [Nitrosarchaeum sp.]|nr:hypothetical protein [Nitrosarchaeum sp.]
MGLNEFDRGSLDKIIDQAINHSKENLNMFIDPKVKQGFHLTNVEDFVFGMVYDEIFHKFGNHFTTFNRRLPNQSENDEIVQVIIKRLAEIRQAIYFKE